MTSLLCSGKETIIEARKALRNRIQALQHDLAGLLLLWRQRADPVLGWSRMPDAYALLARAFVDLGAPLLALEVAAEGLEAEPADVALRQVQGLALARSGSTRAANRVLEELREQGHLEDETLGILARTHKDLGLASQGRPRRNHLEAALRLYGQAYELSHGRWAGINVATLAALQGDAARAAAVAEEVTRECMDALARLEDAHPERYWVLATLGEAALSLRDWAAAERWYREAATCGRQRFGDLNSTRRNARLLLAPLGEAQLVDQWLPLPRVVLFSGHMACRPDRPESCFPPRMERALFASIRAWLESHNGLIGITSSACGADLLFLEALESLGGETHLVLPYDAQVLVEDGVDWPGVEDWRPRFERQLGHARLVYASAGRPLHGGVGCDYAHQLAHGLGLLRARELETEVLALVPCNGPGGDRLGGGASVVRQWQRHGLAVDCVQLDAAPAEPDGLLEMRRLPVVPGPAADEAAAPTADRVMSLLFADVVEFSRLDDAEVPLFVESCLGMVARLVSEAGDSIPVRETWGDGLFLAFDSVQTAGLFALRLLDTVEETDWRALGFSRPLAMRLALHAGPVHLTTDPITGLAKCCGTHVSRAARLEPKTPPGQVYASEAFAALAAMEGARGFRCDYVKQLDWAKRYGTFPAYVLRRDTARGGG